MNKLENISNWASYDPRNDTHTHSCRKDYFLVLMFVRKHIRWPQHIFVHRVAMPGWQHTANIYIQYGDSNHLNSFSQTLWRDVCANFSNFMNFRFLVHHCKLLWIHLNMHHWICSQIIHPFLWAILSYTLYIVTHYHHLKEHCHSFVYLNHNPFLCAVDNILCMQMTLQSFILSWHHSVNCFNFQI